MTYESSTVAYTVASSIYGYFNRCLGLGAAVGELGAMELEPEIRKLVTCIHHVLAGGEIEEDPVVKKGNMDIFNDLEQRFEDGLREANDVNKAAGYYVSVVP